MAKRKRSKGSSEIARRIAQGRGQGRGAAYHGWLMVQDVPSCGNANRLWSPITSREHHLLSDLERNWFIVAHADPRVRDIREQYPLLPLEETLAIAKAAGVDHPTDPRTQNPIVMTTDLVVTVTEGLREFDLARAIKPAGQLSSSRALEKLDLERRFWQSRGVDWATLTDEGLPKALLRNMQWLFPCLDVPRFANFEPAEVDRVRAAMEPAVLEGQLPLRDITFACDAGLGLRPGAALLLARHFIASRQWRIDLNVLIDVRKPLLLL